MSEEKKEIATIVQKNQVSIFSQGDAFETAQRMARALSESDVVPTAYKGKIANCLVALELAQRSGSSPLVVMQNMHFIHGKPGWSSQFIVGAVNSSKRFTPLKFRVEVLGDKTVGSTKIRDRQCIAYATEIATGELVEGPPVSIEMAVREGWYTKPGSKWPTMPELMLRYRAATFFGRLYCPEILLGMQSIEEIRDVTPAGSPAPSAAADLNERIRAKKAAAEAAAESEVIDVIEVSDAP